MLIAEMTLELSLRRFSLLPNFIQTGNGEPRKAHFLGKDRATSLESKQDTGGKRDDDSKQPQTGPYRSLSTITIGEVDDAYRYYENQLAASPNEAWVARNYFCSLPLKRKGDGRPSAVFGRVKTCYPAEGHLQNVEELELYFPSKEGHPDVLHLFADEIALQRPVLSYCVRVKCFVSPQEKEDFSHSENDFVEHGFLTSYETGYLDLIDLSEQNHASLPWSFIFGSEWFTTIPPSTRDEVREKLRRLAYRDRVILNYHPRRYALQYLSLNEELDFNYGFSERVLLAPQDTNQVLMKVEEGFNEMFIRGMK